jgi:2'-5' RNA ligase
VRGGDRIRLFCALRLPAETIERLVAWQARLDKGRLVPPENLHVTLAFLGWVDERRVPEIVGVLRASAAAGGGIRFSAIRYRETRSVGMVVLEDAGDHATAVAGDLHERLAALGVYEPEGRPWLPHVTVLRFRQPPRLTPPPPELGRFSPSDAALYHSVLRSAGAQYEVLKSVALGG